MKPSFITLVIACLALTACSIPAGRRDKFIVGKPFSVVADRVTRGVETELEHGMSWSKDAVISRRIDLADDAVRFQLAQHALDIGTRAPFGNIYVRRASPTNTLIEVIETPQTYGS